MKAGNRNSEGEKIRRSAVWKGLLPDNGSWLLDTPTSIKLFIFASFSYREIYFI